MASRQCPFAHSRQQDLMSPARLVAVRPETLPAVAARRLAFEKGLPVSLRDILEHLNVQCLIGHNPIQAFVLLLLGAGGRLIHYRTVSSMTNVTFGEHFCYRNLEVYDWDGDGDLELLLGWQGATLLYYENIGNQTEHSLAPRIDIHRSGKRVFSRARSRLAIVDLNGVT